MKIICRSVLFAVITSIFLRAGAVYADGNHAPVATAQALTTERNKEIPITLTGTDEDGNALSYDLTSNPVKGKLSGTSPTFKYIPNANYVGTDTFAFKVNDGNLDSAAATVTINVAMPPNKVLTGWWGDFNTADYNDTNTTAVLNGKPNIHKLDPLTSTFYPPSSEYVEKKNGVIQMGWVLFKPNPNSPITQSGGVGGGNRTVFSKGSGAAGTDYRQVWGYFAEPDVSKVNFQRPTNKPTYYFGLEGAISGLNVGSDCGIQWEPAFTDKEDASNNTGAGWTLVNRPTLRYIDSGSSENIVHN